MKQGVNFFNIIFLLGVSAFVVLSLTKVSHVLQKDSVTKNTNQQSSACSPHYITGEIDTKHIVGVFEGEEITVPQIALASDSTAVLGVASDERWIEVDLSDQKLYAWEGETLFLETDVSTGLPWWPTPEGEFRIWIKLRATRMEGGEGAYYYNLPNVPYVMFFENEEVPGYRGYGLHGAYWHNEFGTPRSHGCVNLPIETAKTLYEWTTPILSSGKSVQRSSEENKGTRIIIHK